MHVTQKPQSTIVFLLILRSWDFIYFSESTYQCPSVRPFLRKLVSQFWSYRAETIPNVFFLLQVVYKSEPEGSGNYILKLS